jgi:tetratricopeptide (TPR) repeat protein
VKVLGRIVILAATVVVCTWALWNWCVVPMQRNAALTAITASTEAMDTLPDYAKEQRAGANIERLQKLREQWNADVRVPFLIGVNESSAGHHQKAADAFEEALTLDRRPEIYLARGSEMVALGRTDDAVENYVIAVRFGASLNDAGQSEEIERRVQERMHGR